MDIGGLFENQAHNKFSKVVFKIRNQYKNIDVVYDYFVSSKKLNKYQTMSFCYYEMLKRARSLLGLAKSAAIPSNLAVSALYWFK